MEKSKSKKEKILTIRDSYDGNDNARAVQKKATRHIISLQSREEQIHMCCDARFRTTKQYARHKT